MGLLLASFNTQPITHHPIGLAERNVLTITTGGITQACICSNHLLRILFLAHVRIFDHELLHNCQLPFLHFCVYLEKHAFLGLLLVINNSIPFDSFIGGVNSARLPGRLRHGQLVIDLNRLSDILEYIIYVQKQYQLPLSKAILEKLLCAQINTISEKIAEYQRHVLVKLQVGHVL